MALQDRMFIESPIEQGEDERVAYEVDTTPWGGFDSDAVVAIKLQGTSTPILLEGTVSNDGNVIKTPIVKDLVVGNKYKFEVSWIYELNTLEAFGWITCSAE